MSAKVSASTPAAPPLRRTRLQASARKSSRHTLSISAWNRRPGSSLAFACNTLWSFRTFSDPGRLSPVVMPVLLPASLSNQGFFPPPALPGLRGTTSPSATLTAQPAPHGVPVGACHTTDRASRVAPIPLFHACRRQYPGGTSRCACRSLPGQWQPSPTYRRVGSRIPGFEACSAFTRVAARMVAGSPKAIRSTEVLRTMSLPPSSAPIATGWSDSLPGGIRTR